MPRNLTQKLIESHLAQSSAMIPGSEILLKIDQTLTHDITAVMAYLAFEAMEVPRVQTEVSVSYLDHNLLYIDHKTPDDHIFLQSIAQKYGLYLSRPGNGICHSVHYARFGIPGKTLLGTDSHTTTGGAIGMLAIGAGGMDVAAAMAGFALRLKMPEIIRVHLTGQLRPGVSAKDVVLEMLRRYGVKGGVNKVFEYVGPGVQTLLVPERGTIANMGAEMGATTSVFPADDVVRDFFLSQGRAKDFKAITPDENCCYDDEIQLQLDQLEPLVACPHMPDNIQTVSQVEKTKVHQVYIGSCTNGSYQDFAKAAAILKGKTVHPEVSLTASISTRQIFLELMRNGIIDDLMSSGARITEIACGACTGIGQAPPSGGISVRTSNRNFQGRAGTADAKLYLVSPEVAAATAITGVLTDPRDIVEDIEILSHIQEPTHYEQNDNMILPPLPPQQAASVQIVRGPNIKPLPINQPPQQILSAQVSLKAGDHISTDDITPANAQFSSMRSNIPLIAQYAYSRYDPDFVRRAKQMGTSIIVGGENYGQGSSREHAAITPMYLGVKAVLAKSLARIHKNNLINHGVLPLVFVCPQDYDRTELEDCLFIENLRDQIAQKRIIINNTTKGFTIEALLEISDEEAAVLLCGGRLSYLKKQLTPFHP